MRNHLDVFHLSSPLTPGSDSTITAGVAISISFNFLQLVFRLGMLFVYTESRSTETEMTG